MTHTVARPQQIVGRLAGVPWQAWWLLVVVVLFALNWGGSSPRLRPVCTEAATVEFQVDGRTTLDCGSVETPKGYD
jgi:hypothetical protein